MCIGVLLYFVDGVLPLVRYFFANLFSPPKEGESRDKQLRITDHLLMNLLVCVSRYVGDSYHPPFPPSPAEPL